MSTVLLRGLKPCRGSARAFCFGLRGPDRHRTAAQSKSVGSLAPSISQNNADPLQSLHGKYSTARHYELCEELEYMTCPFRHHLADALRCVTIGIPTKR